MADEQTTTVQDNPVVEEKTILGSGASDNQDWRSSLNDELKNNPTIQNIKDLESAATTLVHQQKMIGSRIPIPKTDAELREELKHLLSTIAVVRGPYDPSDTNGSGSIQ